MRADRRAEAWTAEWTDRRWFVVAGAVLLGAVLVPLFLVLAWLDHRHQGWAVADRVVALDLAGHGESAAGRQEYTVEAFGADYAYTLDGSDLGEIEDETFCADSAIVTFVGRDIHPGYAKDKATFTDAMATVRRLFWEETIFAQPYFRRASEKVPPKLREFLMNHLCQAA